MTMADSETQARDMFNSLFSLVSESNLPEVTTFPSDLSKLSVAAKRILYLMEKHNLHSQLDVVHEEDRSSQSMSIPLDSHLHVLQPNEASTEPSLSGGLINHLDQNLVIINKLDQPLLENSSLSRSNDEALSQSSSSQAMEGSALGPELPCQPETELVAGVFENTSIDSERSSSEPNPNMSAPDPLFTDGHPQGTEVAMTATPEEKALLAQVQPTQLPIIKRDISLPNARVGEKYQFTSCLGDIKQVGLRVNDVPNIHFDTDSHEVIGTPTQSGDFKIVLDGLLDGSRCEITLNLAVIADPKSLWISKPSDPDSLYAKVDEYSFHDIKNNLLLLGASKRGRSHAQVGSFRDDDFSVDFNSSSEWYLAVVADGAGSAPYSRRGSQIVVESIQRSLPLLLDKHLHDIEDLVTKFISNDLVVEKNIRNKLYLTLASAALKAANEIYQESLREGIPEDQFSTTLIFTIARKCSMNWFVAGFGIGDGGAGILDLGGQQVVTLNKPDSGDYGGQTRFLHASAFKDNVDISQRIFFDIREGFDALVLMTDGITDPKFPTDNAFNNYETWSDFWYNDLCPAVDILSGVSDCKYQLLDWLDFWSPGNHDDRTIVILKPLGE